MKKHFLAALAVCVFAVTSASAADFTATMKDPDGKPITICPEGKPDCGKTLTLYEVSLTSLAANFPDERDVTGDEKFQRGELATRIHDDKKLSLTAEETARLKKVIGKYPWNTLVIYQAFKDLDPATGAKK